MILNDFPHKIIFVNDLLHILPDNFSIYYIDDLSSISTFAGLVKDLKYTWDKLIWEVVTIVKVNSNVITIYIREI